MIIVDIEQGTTEWFETRCGVISASNFSKIITPTGKVTTGVTREKYLLSKAAEILSGKPEETYSNQWMERGVELEEEARKILSLEYMTEINEVGFCFLDDNKRIGCSPDGLNSDIGFEIKCPKPSTHVKYLLDNKLPTEYIPQVQGSMFVTGFETWIFMSYCPGIKPLILEVKRDDEYISKLSDAVNNAVDEVDNIIKKIRG